MRIKSAQILLLVFLFIIAATSKALDPVAAQNPPRGLLAAGVISLPQTGQTTSYAAGDDGALQTGEPWPATRFTDNANGSLTDTLTGLTWAKDAGSPTAVTCSGGRTSWQGALDYVACLNLHAYLGFSDWRLPNIVEMESLSSDGAADNIAWLTGQGFSNVQTYYWSSTTYAGALDYAWTVILWSSPQVSLFDPKTTTATYYAWPARGTSTLPARLRQSGQTVSYAVGDDGQLETGVALPEARFSLDASGGCLSDELTGLMWMRSPLPTLRTWPEAIDYANRLNLCGYTDWRLPNRLELRSLVNFGEVLNAPALNTQGFSGIKNRQYWTSTTDAYDTGRAWSIDLGSGLDNFAYKPGYATNALLALAVRSGAAAPTGSALSGSVTMDGESLAGVALTLSGPVNHVTQTEANGAFSFAGLPDGSYTLTPAMLYHGFSPTQRTVTLAGANTSGLDFSAGLTSIYGLVNLSDNQAGLLKGDNQSLSGIQQVTSDGTTRLLISSANPARVYRSVDGAVSLQAAELRHGVQDLYMFPDGQTAFAVGGAYGSKTSDGGQTWTRVTIGGTLYAVHFANTAVGYAAGNSGAIYRTGDGGATWVRKTAPLNSSISIYSVWAPDGSAPDTVYVTIANAATTVYRSLDGGDTWTAMTLPGIGNSAMNALFFKDPGAGWAAGDEGEIFKFSGGVWSKKTTPVTETLMAIAFAPDGLNGWAVGNNAAILRTGDGGETWTQVGSELGIKAHLTGVTILSANEAYITGYANTLLKYTSLSSTPLEPAVFLPLIRR